MGSVYGDQGMPNINITDLESIRALSAVGIALSAEKDERHLMELIVQSAKQLTNADGGTFYSRTEDDELKFEIMHTDTLGVHMGGTSGMPIDLPNVPLFDDNGNPNHKMVAAKAAVTGETVNIRDAYDAPDFDFSGTQAFDEIRVLKQKLKAKEKGERINEKKLDKALTAELEQLERDRKFLNVCNIRSESMAKADQERVGRIGSCKWVDNDGDKVNFLSEEEIYNLNIKKGTLTPEEREIINYHIVATIKMLESLPYPKHLRRVPEFACGHHEKMDGSGSPRGLTREEMSVQARVMGIADIFEALTAEDRPYKHAMPISEALQILGRMKLNNHIDPDLFDVFLRKKVYMQYAQQFLEPRQIDYVDVSKFPATKCRQTRFGGFTVRTCHRLPTLASAEYSLD